MQATTPTSSVYSDHSESTAHITILLAAVSSSLLSLGDPSRSQILLPHFPVTWFCFAFLLSQVLVIPFVLGFLHRSTSATEASHQLSALPFWPHLIILFLPSCCCCSFFFLIIYSVCVGILSAYVSVCHMHARCPWISSDCGNSCEHHVGARIEPGSYGRADCFSPPSHLSSHAS